MMRLAAAGAWLLTAHAALNALLLRDPPRHRPAASRSGLVSVLVPARNEATRIGACLAAVLASRDVELAILVFDDESADETAAVAAAAAGGDPRVRILSGRPPPPGWLGKPHACAQLARAARGRILVFLDADVLLTPDGLARAVGMLESGVLHLVCPYPRQMVDGPATRLVQPLLQWSWLTFLPLRLAERSPRPSLVAANGQLLLCAAEDYARAGGHTAVSHAVLEDLELARAFKRSGLRAGVVAGHEVATCAMYRTWREVRAGYTKSLWAAFGSPRGAAAVTTALLGLYVVPVLVAGVATARGDHALSRRAWLAVAGGVSGRLISALRTGGIPADALWHPASVAALATLTRASFRARAAGQLSWRGRVLPLDG